MASLIATTLQRAVEKRQITSWDATNEGIYIIQVMVEGNHSILRYGPEEAIAFCDGLLVAS